ncbi:AAA family ATPase [Streptomyces sp. NBC_00669]|uniref:AAA family ATPase n=1 Tax=Streptomyces sp. NBC_00669 TaxID=2976011 RepID=UPI002E35E88B|nr:AAA family ATPase [Streptomyces sp. NBC_00669]
MTAGTERGEAEQGDAGQGDAGQGDAEKSDAGQGAPEQGDPGRGGDGGPPRGIAILPYSYVVGQDELKLALELNYIADAIGGVLISGQPGTAKSTVVRAFALMARGRLPVTLTIDATDDRVLGGWELNALLRGETREQPGLLEAAHADGLLYIDEVNLLNDHVVNIILDVSSTGVLSVQREGIDKVMSVNFGLVGTMNPEEGGLRPQLLDRFGLMATAQPLDADQRHAMLRAVLRFDEESGDPGSAWLAEGHRLDRELRERLLAARARLFDVEVPDAVVRRCADIAAALQVVGHRGEVVMLQAARAHAAAEGAPAVTAADLRATAPLALRHRRPESTHGGSADWTPDDLARLDDLLA